MSNEEFYASTVNELNLRIRGYNKKQKNDAELWHNLIKLGVACGQNLKKSKNFKLFEDDQESKIGYISLEEKEKELDILESMFR